MELPPRTRVAVSSMEETPGSSTLNRRMAGRMGEHLMVDCESIMEHLLRKNKISLEYHMTPRLTRKLR